MTLNDLHYGWKIAAGVTLAAATIYVAGNTRRRVNQADVIELALGVHERCLATQRETNSVYFVAPPSFVRSWYSNSYETQVVAGVTSVVAVLGTNIVTNAIGFRTDRAMLVELDAKIKALVPQYVNTGTLEALTVTGLWAELGIGDGTNQFTQVPAIGTNPAAFGAWSRRAYLEAFEERYKVLNALRKTKSYMHVVSELRTFGTNYYWSGINWTEEDYNQAWTNALGGWNAAGVSTQVSYWADGSYVVHIGRYSSCGYFGPNGIPVEIVNRKTTARLFQTNVPIRSAQIMLFVTYDEFDPRSSAETFSDFPSEPTFEEYTNMWNLTPEISSVEFGNVTAPTPYETSFEDAPKIRGYTGGDIFAYVDWDFLYATNRYWE